MSSNRNDQATSRRYLLGQFTGDDLEQFEQQLFSDDELFEELLSAEDELIDESIAGNLSRDESEQFAKFFLTTQERKQNLRFRRALNRYLETKNKKYFAVPRTWRFWPAESWMIRTAAALATLVIIIGLAGIGTLLRNRQGQPRNSLTVNLTISTSSRAEGAQAVKVKLPLNADELRLHLALPEPLSPAKGYRVELLRDNGETRTLEIVARDEKSIVVVPALPLASGQYALKAYLIKPDGTEQRISGSYFLTIE